MIIYIGTVAISFSINYFAFKNIITESNKKISSSNQNNKVFNSFEDFLLLLGLSVIPGVNLLQSGLLLFKKNDLINNNVQTEEQNIIEIPIEKIPEDFSEKKVISYRMSGLTNNEKLEFLKEELKRLTGQNIEIDLEVCKQKRI